MLRWFPKWGAHKKVDELNTSVKKSFTNIREDMLQVTNWISHFKEEHDSHKVGLSKQTEELSKVLERLDKIEQVLSSGVSIVSNVEGQESPETSSGFSEKEEEHWDKLTDVQQNLAWRILALTKEKANGWHTLNDAGRELYPKRQYSRIRSTIAHYVGILEDMGYVERKRTSRETYIRSIKKRLPECRNWLGELKISD